MPPAMPLWRGYKGVPPLLVKHIVGGWDEHPSILTAVSFHATIPPEIHSLSKRVD